MVHQSGNQLTVSGYLHNLTRISDFVVQAARQAGLDDRGVYAVQMAVDEACANIIEHAYGGEGRGDIRLVYHLLADGLQIVIYDHGEPFELSHVLALDTSAPLEKRQAGGMGVFFINQLMDHIEFEFGTPQGNQLILIKRRETAL